MRTSVKTIQFHRNNKPIDYNIPVKLFIASHIHTHTNTHTYAYTEYAYLGVRLTPAKQPKHFVNLNYIAANVDTETHVIV